MLCEQNNCRNEIEVVNSHSIIATVQYVHKTKGYAYTYCRQGQMYNGQNVQHFCCTKECMLSQMKECLSSHEHEPLTYIPVEQVHFHTVVLSRDLKCALCDNSLEEEAYRICLCYATPVSHMINEGHTEFGEWCCSLEHAKQLALRTINTL